MDNAVMDSVVQAARLEDAAQVTGGAATRTITVGRYMAVSLNGGSAELSVALSLSREIFIEAWTTKLVCRSFSHKF
jgi:hypothetical protein